MTCAHASAGGPCLSWAPWSTSRSRLMPSRCTEQLDHLPIEGAEIVGAAAVRRPRSITASWSTQSAPARLRSVLSDGHEVIRRLRAAPARVSAPASSRALRGSVRSTWSPTIRTDIRHFGAPWSAEWHGTTLRNCWPAPAALVCARPARSVRGRGDGGGHCSARSVPPEATCWRRLTMREQDCESSSQRDLSEAIPRTLMQIRAPRPRVDQTWCHSAFVRRHNTRSWSHRPLCAPSRWQRSDQLERRLARANTSVSNLMLLCSSRPIFAL